MKAFFVLVAATIATVVISTQAYAQSALLEFSNGNQIYGSQLAIDENGGIVHSERTCCPPTTNQIPEQSLSADDLQHLIDLIQKVSTGAIEVKEGEVTSEGGLSGSLVVYAGGSAVVVRSITRSQIPDGRDTISVNLAPEAQEIEEIVKRYVAHPLP